MKYTLAFVLVAFLGTPILATGPVESDGLPLIRPADDSNLSEFLWKNRPVVVFADSPSDPRFVQQIELLERELSQLADRDIVVLTDSDPSAASPLRTKLRPRGFMLVLLGKDGGVRLRKPLPWSVRELTRVIDKMPIRQQEVRDRRVVE